METLDDIWSGDLLGRRKEAEDLIGYLESVTTRPSIREDGHAHVLAVDSPYGQGKTFFLRRLDRHLKATDHVSAFIDAWVDDLEDEPIVALAATLDQAIKPWISKAPGLSDALTAFKSKAGRVAKIVAKGLATRGVGLVLTQGAAEALGDELARASETTRDIQKHTLEDAGPGVVNDVLSAVGGNAASSMDARIARFREGQAAIVEMKQSLGGLVNLLAEAGMALPVTIIVDELDRCRPTYALKTLEEIKHLFDVSGVAFVLGLHGQQLAHSVTAAYGAQFNGSAYLRRFFNRRYRLKDVELAPLIHHFISVFNLNEQLMDHPSTVRPNEAPKDVPPAEMISAYMRVYGLKARDALAIGEALQTAMALTEGQRVQLAYLIPLLIGQHLGLDGLPSIVHIPRWGISKITDRYSHEYEIIPLETFLEELDRMAQLNDNELSQVINEDSSPAGRLVVNYGFRNGRSTYALLQNYRELVRVVARFK